MEAISLIDTHAHLDELNNLSKILKEAKEAGVRGIIAVGSDVESNKKILEISIGNPAYVYPAIGYHPWNIKDEEVEENLSFIQSHVNDCVALGEIGLDYKIKVKKELQQRVFEELLNIAYRFDKAIIVHCRYSHRQTLKRIMDKKIRRAVFHWYSGPLDLLDEILAEGYFISATPALTYSPPHREAIQRTPLERILLETDSPVSYQGVESSPKDVRITLEQVGILKRLDLSIVSKQTIANASHFFQIPFIIS